MQGRSVLKESICEYFWSGNLVEKLIHRDGSRVLRYLFSFETGEPSLLQFCLKSLLILKIFTMNGFKEKDLSYIVKKIDLESHGGVLDCKYCLETS